MIVGGPRSTGDGVLTLREVRRADAARLHQWRNHPASREMFHSTAEIPYQTHLRFLERYFDADNRDAWFVAEAEGRPVGSIVLYDLSADGSTAEWGRFVIAPEERGRGYGRRALCLLIEWARERGVRELRCDVLASNQGPRRLYRELGFRETGALQAGGREFVTMRALISSPAPPTPRSPSPGPGRTS